ncbi:hypothetical protein ACRRVB_03925 [Candidatus Cardinium hertigii]|uniref:hypothetical protein n=1 Tax=Candidatus Cardinium hertigii TaxID=247481 RepID=UPI003D7EFCB3
MIPFLYSKFMVPLYFFCFQTIEVGFVDAIEFKYVNSTLFYQHNFPDILAISRGGAYEAFISGVKCCPPLLIPCGLKILALSMNKNVSTKRLFKVHAGYRLVCWQQIYWYCILLIPIILIYIVTIFGCIDYIQQRNLLLYQYVSFYDPGNYHHRLYKILSHIYDFV